MAAIAFYRASSRSHRRTGPVTGVSVAGNGTEAKAISERARVASDCAAKWSGTRPKMLETKCLNTANVKAVSGFTAKRSADNDCFDQTALDFRRCQKKATLPKQIGRAHV